MLEEALYSLLHKLIICHFGLNNTLPLTLYNSLNIFSSALLDCSSCIVFCLSLSTVSVNSPDGGKLSMHLLCQDVALYIFVSIVQIKMAGKWPRLMNNRREQFIFCFRLLFR